MRSDVALAHCLCTAVVVLLSFNVGVSVEERLLAREELRACR